MMLGILGGVKWGYNIAADMSVSVLAPMTLMETADIRDRFNTALGTDFNGWTIADTGTLWEGQQIVVVPEPASLMLFCFTLYPLAARRPARRMAA